MRNLTWLTVGGCERSGTTALGNALRESSSIQLFHEVQPHIFFECLNGLFTDEQRLGVFPEFAKYAHLLPIAERDAAAIVEHIFEVVFQKRTPVVGSKMPGFFVRPRPTMPPGIAEKTVVISRNPYDMVLSWVLQRQRNKANETAADGAEVSLKHWVRGWNYAVARYGDKDFFHILYDELDGVENARIARELAGFLGIEPDFDLARMQPRIHANVAERYAAANLEHVPAQIGQLFAYEDWPEQARHFLKNKAPFCFPLHAGDEIDFTLRGNRWKYAPEGFYSPEPAGSWTRGERSAVRFVPVEPMSGDLFCRIEVIWVAAEDEKGSLVATIRVNGQDAGRQEFCLGAHQGRGRWFTVRLEGVQPNPGALLLEICVENPRNPKALGLNNDDRSLGLMIRGLSLNN